MMVNVLVLAYAPFITLERSEKAMHIPVRASRAFRVKVGHQCLEPRASGFEIRFVSYDQGRTCRYFFRERPPTEKFATAGVKSSDALWQ